jgi:hypothetical protein
MPEKSPNPPVPSFPVQEKVPEPPSKESQDIKDSQKSTENVKNADLIIRACKEQDIATLASISTQPHGFLNDNLRKKACKINPSCNSIKSVTNALFRASSTRHY